MPEFLIYGHRGASAHVRANTTEAFALAVELGADGVELDVRPSRDGVMVIHHDDRPSPGAPPFVDLDFAQIRAATPWVPTLDEAWDSIGPTALLNIEIKNDEREADYDPTHQIAIAVADWLAAHETGDRVLVSSFNRPTLAAVKALAPDVPTGQLAGARARSPGCDRSGARRWSCFGESVAGANPPRCRTDRRRGSGARRPRMDRQRPGSRDCARRRRDIGDIHG